MCLFFALKPIFDHFCSQNLSDDATLNRVPPLLPQVAGAQFLAEVVTVQGTSDSHRGSLAADSITDRSCCTPLLQNDSLLFHGRALSVSVAEDPEGANSDCTVASFNRGLIRSGRSSLVEVAILPQQNHKVLLIDNCGGKDPGRTGDSSSVVVNNGKQFLLVLREEGHQTSSENDQGPLGVQRSRDQQSSRAAGAGARGPGSHRLCCCWISFGQGRGFFQLYLLLGMIGFFLFWLILMLRIYLPEKYWRWSYMW